MLKKIIGTIITVFALSFSIFYVAEVKAADIVYSGKSGDLDWSIDSDGCLRISGNGDYELVEHSDYYSDYGNLLQYDAPQWVKYNDDIKTAIVNVTNITSTKYMFEWCCDLKSLDLSNLDTSHVVDMSHMFEHCGDLESLDLSNLDTSHVVDMSYMFSHCIALESLDLSNFDTSHVVDMSHMFEYCGFDDCFGGGLESLDLSNFNTSQVIDMSYMFAAYSGNDVGFKNLDLSNFDTSQVINMEDMFSGQENLAYLDLGSFRTPKVNNMRYMFYGCDSLVTLDLSNFNTEQVTDMGYMFSQCSSLESLDLSNFNTKQVTNMTGLFDMCCRLRSLNLKSFDTSQVTSMASMFENCTRLESLDLSNFNTERVTNMSSMFWSCRALKSLDLSNFNTKQVTNMELLFCDCYNLQSLNLKGFDTSQVTYMWSMFKDCKKLESLDLSSFDISQHNVDDENSFWNIFSGCISLKQINTPINKTSEKYNLYIDEGTSQWKDASGKVYTKLPGHIDHSIVLTRETSSGNTGGEGSNSGESGGSSSNVSLINNSKANIKAAFPKLDNLGTAKLKGPEISVVGNTFNLFKMDMKMSLPFFSGNSIDVKVDSDTKTAEVLIGLKEDEAGIDTSDDGKYWSETYREIKSLVKACGGKTDTTKLWNQFSNARGKLKSVKANVAFKVKGNAAGYMKLQMNDDGTIQKILEGGWVVGFEAEGSVKAPLWWIVYSEFGVGGSIDGKAYLTLENMKSITNEGEMELAIKPSIALGADAVIADVKGGIEGKIAGKATFPWEEFKKSFTAYLTGKAFIKVDTIVPNLSGEFPYNFSKLELYPNLGKVTKTMSTLQYEEPDPVTSQMIKAMAADSENAVDTTKDSLVYENAKPTMISLADGKILMVYLDDTDGEAKLMYRIYDGSEWSEASKVYSGGNLDTAGYLYQYGDKVYVIFESSSQEITENMSASEIASLMNLYVAEYTGNGFSAPSLIGNTGTWKYDYHLAENDGNLCAIWAENSENDIMLTSGSTIIYESKFTNDTWQQATQLASMNETLTEVESGMVGDTFTTAYIKENQVYVGEEILNLSEVEEDAQIVDSLTIQNGYLYVRIDGKLYSYDGIGLKDRNVECSTSYQIYDGSVYWIQQNNFKSEIIRKPLDSEANPVAITDEGGYVGGFTIVHNAEGKPVLAYTYQQVKEETQDENPYGLTLLKFTEGITRYQADVTNVAYDILSFTSGEENLINVTVCNTGTDELHQVVLTIKDGDTVLYSDVVADSMIAGETLECSVPVSIPEGFVKENLTFSLQADEAFKKDATQSYEIETCTADMEIINNGTDEIIVKNNAPDTAKDVTVIVRNENESGAEIRNIAVGNLEAGESSNISVKADWSKALKNMETNKKYLYCEVTQQGDEYELWNNSIIIERSESAVVPSAPVKVSKIILSGISKQIAAGKKINLTASVLPGNAANKAVTWKSSNTKVATVSQSGVVTMNRKSGGKTVTITATAKDGSGVQAVYKIKSMKGVVKKVSISGSKSVKAGKSLKLKAKVTVTKGANKKLKWISSNPKYAQVTSSGKVKTYKAGKGKKVKITAMATDGSGKKKSVTIKIK